MSAHEIRDGKADRPGSGLWGRLTGEELQAARAQWSAAREHLFADEKRQEGADEALRWLETWREDVSDPVLVEREKRMFWETESWRPVGSIVFPHLSLGVVAYSDDVRTTRPGVFRLSADETESPHARERIERCRELGRRALDRYQAHLWRTREREIFDAYWFGWNRGEAFGTANALADAAPCPLCLEGIGHLHPKGYPTGLLSRALYETNRERYGWPNLDAFVAVPCGGVVRINPKGNT